MCKIIKFLSLLVALNVTILFSQTAVTARQFYNLCYTNALNYGSDIKLLIMRGMDLDTTGRTTDWSCKMISLEPEQTFEYTYSMDSAAVDTIIPVIPIGIFVVETEWFDSDTALKIAEQNGGQACRQAFPGCKIFAYLSRRPSPPFYTYWKVTYDDYMYIAPHLNIYINALTEEIISGTEPGYENNIKQNFILYNNYPNPFNNSTVFHFKLEQKSLVKLNIYDVCGHKLETVINNHLKPGPYKIKWEPKGYASGIYFYSLTVNSENRIHKLILIK